MNESRSFEFISSQMASRKGALVSDNAGLIWRALSIGV